MADALKKLMDLKLKAYQSEAKTLRDELTNAQPDPTVIEDTLEIAGTKMNAVFEIQQQLIDAYAAAGKEQEYLDEEAHQGKLQRELKTLKRSVSEFQLACAVPVTGINPAVKDASNFHLPQMKLPSFSGDVREWLGFWASFEPIHTNAGIPQAQKFQCLLQCLKTDSDARKVISAFPVCAKNYDAAVETLTKQFGRPKMLVKVYVLDLLQLVIKNATNKSKVNVMEFVPQLASQIRNLSELGVTDEKCEQVLYPVVEASLPDEILQVWQRNPKYDESLKPLLDFLNNEVLNQMDRSLAKITFGSTGTSSNSGKKDKNTGNSLETPAAAALMVVQADGKGAPKPKIKVCVL